MLIPPAPNSPIPSEASSPSEAAAWENVSRLCRRVAVLRERGEAPAADAVEQGALASALAALCTTTDQTEAAAQARLDAIVAVERERVANAAVLAELLAPLLREGAAAEPRPAPAAPAPEFRAVADVVRPRASSGDIADFIDEMIALDRPVAAPARRAS